MFSKFNQLEITDTDFILLEGFLKPELLTEENITNCKIQYYDWEKLSFITIDKPVKIKEISLLRNYGKRQIISKITGSFN